MPKSPPVEVVVQVFTGTDAELLVKLEDLVKEGKTLAAIHDQGDVRYLYFYRDEGLHPSIRWEQERISTSGDWRDIQSFIDRESLAGWHFATAYAGKDGMIQLFFVRLVPPEIEERG